MSDINKRIKLLRRSLKLSQTEFGRKIGKGIRAIQHWEAGEVSIPLNVLTHIEETYNVNPLWLRKGEGDMFKEDKFSEFATDEIKTPKTDSRDALIIAALRMATDEQKDFILKYIKEQNELSMFREKAQKNKKLG